MTENRFLAGEFAVVTGAGSGLGRCIALALGHTGADVALVGRGAAKLESVAAELAAAHVRTSTHACDVSDPRDVERLHADLAEESVSILINNAGIGGPVSNLVDITSEQWDEVFATNVRGTFLCCKAFLPHMLAARSGHIVNLASVSGKRPLSGRTPYAASKMAVLGLTATLAFEVGDRGVQVNSLSPGPIRGDRMTRNFRLEAGRSGTTAAAAEEQLVSRAALRRLLEEQEVAQAVLAMLQMPGLTGADIDLSAGMIAR